MDVALVYKNVRNARGRQSLQTAVLLLAIVAGIKTALLTAAQVALIGAVVSTGDAKL
jgi:hypothetical protein